MHRSVVSPLASLALLGGCGSAQNNAPKVDVDDAILTLPAAAGGPGAAYFRLEASAPVRLTGIESRRIGRIEIHEPGMRRVESIALVPGEPLAFAPGGRHAMLFDLDPALRPGERLLLTLRFEGVPAIGVETEVRRPGDVHRGH